MRFGWLDVYMALTFLWGGVDSKSLQESRFYPDQDTHSYMLSLNPQYLILLFALILFCVVNAASQVITIDGHVRTPQAERISDVRIDSLAKTDAAGHFKIAADFLRYWNTLWIDKKGFVPKLLSIHRTAVGID